MRRSLVCFALFGAQISAFGCVRDVENRDFDGDGIIGWLDCDDRDPGVGAPSVERCNGLDDDCDGQVDEEATDRRWSWLDADGDGIGAVSIAVRSCSLPEDHVRQWGDCDDSDPDTYPGGVERCDGVDNDCNGRVDDGAEDAVPWFEDFDGDGYGAGVPLLACERPPLFQASSEDCDDADPRVNPSAMETCDGVDNNCNDEIDEAAC